MLNSATTNMLASLSNEGAGLLHRLLSLYLTESPKLFQRMIRSLKVGDFDELLLTSHTLKSSSLQLGAERVASVCAEIEKQAGGSMDTANCLHLLSQASEEYTKVEVEMGRLLKP